MPASCHFPPGKREEVAEQALGRRGRKTLTCIGGRTGVETRGSNLIILGGINALLGTHTLCLCYNTPPNKTTTELVSKANTQGLIDYKLEPGQSSSTLDCWRTALSLWGWGVFKRKKLKQGGTSLGVSGLGEGMQPLN